jgi:hypothetical protein
VAGFAGVIGAFSQFRMHAEATAFRVRSMVSLAIGEMIFALLPIVLANFGISPGLLWGIAGVLLAVFASALMSYLGRSARRLYARGHLLRRAAQLMVVFGLAALIPLWLALLGIGGLEVVPCYFALLFYGMAVCGYHFILLIYAVRLDGGE